MFLENLRLLKPIFYKNVEFLAYFFLYVNIFANTWIKNPHFNLFCQYILLLTKVKQVFKLIKDKKEIGDALLAVISL